MKINVNVLPLRIIKTVIAFFISLVLSPYFYCDSFFAGIGSLKSMRESLTLSIQSLFEQLLSNFIAIVFAVIYSFIFGLNVFSISFALLSLLLVIKRVNFIDTYLAAAFTLLAVMLLSDSQTELLNRSFDRFYSTFFGMVIALIVNAAIFRPKNIDNLNQILIKLNNYVHIIMAHDLDEYAYLELQNTLADLEREKNIATEELNVRFISKNKRISLYDRLNQISVVETQAEVIFDLFNLDLDFRDEIIPIIIKLNGISQYPSDENNNEIVNIKDEIKILYNQYTNDENFFKHTNFLSNLNVYINTLTEANRLEK
ncbi:aromatic acid exporter family protein [Erysipelotrichaceae bacterium OttesenSCG-928-M19]|nr:aromatic acid exporter family protein [Erysipelotrichaceae bacterium OttesenSCG-928-M19]